MRQCPFCESEDVGIINILERVYAVGCRSCGMTGPQATTLQEAMNLWEQLCDKSCHHCISRPWGKALAKRVAQLSKDYNPASPVTS